MSDPPFFHKIIDNAWKSITLPRSDNEVKLPISSPSSVTRMRTLTIAMPYSHGSDCLPLYYANAIEVEKLDYHHPIPKSPLTLPIKIVWQTFAALGYQTMSTSQDQPSILGVAMVIAFAASFSVMFIKNSYPRLAAIVEKIGYLSFALSFLVMTKGFFSGSLIMWIIIGGLALAWVMLALLKSFFI